MYCENCGKLLDTDVRFCSKCGSEIKTSSKAKAKENDMTRKWSWGAFGLTWIYLCYMRYSLWWLVLMLFFLSSSLAGSNNFSLIVIGIMLELIVRIYFGMFGRSIAWDKRIWPNMEKYKGTQQQWDIWGIMLFVLWLAVGFYQGA